VDALTRSSFISALRDAMNHLYDAEHLRRNPLVGVFSIENRLDTSSLLRGILTNSIEELKPPGSEMATEHAWRIYDSLYYCYVQRQGQQAVADQLGLSARQLRREQRAALELLADALCQRYNLQDRVCDDQSAITPSGLGGSADGDGYTDLDWLRTAQQEKPVDFSEALHTVLELLQPLADSYASLIIADIPDGLPRLAIHPLVLEQILLSLLGALIPRAVDSSVTVRVSRSGQSLDLRVEVGSGSENNLDTDDANAALEIVEQLADLSNCSLSVVEDEGSFVASLVLPLAEQITVLAIDDNPDILQLLERFLHGTRYHLVGIREPELALEMAGQVFPHVIILDVMMPGIDGWKLLGRLRQHPTTELVPVIICTILPQEKLALSLGAAGFIRKPVGRRELLEALDQQILLTG
jgi:CheY-like chemotaxis protein